MPFVDQQARLRLCNEGLKAAEYPGEICFLAYKEIMKRWKEKPRWTTIHEIRRDIEGDLGLLDPTDLQDHFDLEDVHTAELLAFDVFFSKIGMEYERKKELENGSIE